MQMVRFYHPRRWCRIRCMNARDLVLTAGYFESPTRVPVTPYDGNFAARCTGTKIDAYCTDAETMAAVQLAAQTLTKQDMLVAQSDGYYMAEGFGLPTKRRQDDTPIPEAPLIEHAADAAGLSVPDPLRDGRMPVYIEAIRLLRRRVGNDMAIRATGTGPLSLAGHLMGIERFVTELAMAEVEADLEREQALGRLMALCTEATTRFALAALEAGADVVQIGDSLASLDMISPAIYRKWAYPHERLFFDAVRPAAEQRGALGLLHICGDTTIIIDEMANTGAHILEIDWKVDLQGARAVVGNRCALMGNLDPSSVLLQGTAGGVRKAAERL